MSNVVDNDYHLKVELLELYDLENDTDYIAYNVFGRIHYFKSKEFTPQYMFEHLFWWLDSTSDAHFKDKTNYEWFITDGEDYNGFMVTSVQEVSLNYVSKQLHKTTYTLN